MNKGYLSVFLLLAAGCGSALVSSYSIQPETSPSKVTLKDHRTGTTIGLLNESHTSKDAFYSESRRDADYKVVSDLQMGALMLQLEKNGLFREAVDGAVRVPGARTSILVNRGGRTWTLAFNTLDGADRQQLVQDCRNAVRAIYDANQSFQVVDNQKGAGFFLEEQNKLREEGRNRGRKR
jgi:hypothetical protein